MLNSVDLNDKSYEELLAEAISKIPLYSREWTNFNVSDPGITILQNLTAFQMLQQAGINEMTVEARRNLLKLAGYTAQKNQSATVLVQAPLQGGDTLPEGHQLWSGSIPFETVEEVTLQPWGVAAIYGEQNGAYRNLTRQLEGRQDTMVYPFGRHPQKGNALVCVLSGVPEVGEPIRLWMRIAEEELRTPFEDGVALPAFSKVRWQYYTHEGWQDARALDETVGFLRSGTVTLWLEGDMPAQLMDTPVQGCALRCLLEEANFDRMPRLQYMAAHLFPVVQKQTRVQCMTFSGTEHIELKGRLAELNIYQVFCREEENGPYYRYHQGVPGRTGRVYQVRETLRGIELDFDPASGYGPCADADAVRVICYDEEMIHHRVLGVVYGYDHQEIQMDLLNRVLPDSFLVAIEEETSDGLRYFFLRPRERGEDGFSYHLRTRSSRLVIDDPGRGGYRILLAACAVTEGARGNLRAGSFLEQRGGYDGTEVEERFFSPAPGYGGVSYEGIGKLRARFSGNMRSTSVAVKTADYEKLVHKTPGLCIHKVKAVAFGRKNLVKIAVKPYTEEEFPKLSEEYLQQIRAFLEPRRLLTTRVEICQPRYAQVGVYATISIRGMDSYAREEAERVLRTALDYINGPQNFGEWVRFNELYRKLSELPFVEAVDGLSLYPESREATLVGSDIYLDDDCLCYPGTIRLTINKYGH